MEQSILNFDSPHLLSDEEAVLSCLGHGRQAATSSTIIEARTGLRPRRVQQIIRKLRARGIKVLMVAARFSKRSLRMEFDQGVLEQEGEG